MIDPASAPRAARVARAPKRLPARASRLADIAAASGAALMAAVAAFAAPSPAHAQGTVTPVQVGDFRDWGAFSYQGPKGKVCFAHSQPEKFVTTPPGRSRDPAHFFITHRPGEGVKGEVSVIVGFPHSESERAVITVGSSKFNLITNNDDANVGGAWIEDQAQEAQLLQAMRAGVDMTVQSMSTKGTKVLDTYSLLGISSALDKINADCP